jgi:hypothetical protein
MKRNYTSGEANDVQFFTGVEVEHTPAFGMNTLFVTGVQSTQDIQDWLDDFNSYEDKKKHIGHIFFGANHSYKPKFNDYDDWKQWDDMIEFFLKKEYLCSLDIPINLAEDFLESGLTDYNNFIPQIRIPLPYIKLWNYNTMIKIDDKDFNATNPGVWSHSLHTLMDRSKFTDWAQYKNDKVIK